MPTLSDNADERIWWPYSIRTLSGRVAALLPVYLPPDPASRTVYIADKGAIPLN